MSDIQQTIDNDVKIYTNRFYTPRTTLRNNLIELFSQRLPNRVVVPLFHEQLVICELSGL